jgi:hypothetical protein
MHITIGMTHGIDFAAMDSVSVWIEPSKRAMSDLWITETLMSEENKAIVRSNIEEIWNKGNLNSIENFISSGFVSHLHRSANR